MKLLREMNYTIVDIAEQKGYNNYKYFSRKFKEIAKNSQNTYINTEGGR
jgi:YesN/AraC family two-component response regulator